MPQPTCRSTYAACACGDMLEGYLACDGADALVCQCESPVSTQPLDTCFEACGGDPAGDWLLTDICGAAWAPGNCDHLVHTATAQVMPSGLSFDGGGVVTGNLAYSGQMHAGLTDVCARRQNGGSISSCETIDSQLESELRGLLGNALTDSSCSRQMDACECEVDVRFNQQLQLTYEFDTAASVLELGDVSVEYCVKDDMLSFRATEDDFTFRYERSKLDLPFEAISLGAVVDAPAPVQGFDVGDDDCNGDATFDTDALTASCGERHVRGAAWGPAAVHAFFLRSLVVPEGAELQFEGSAPAIVVADTIDIRGSVSFRAPASFIMGRGASGSNIAGGGGGHCTAGGDGGFWTDGVARQGGASHGSFEALSFGGPGGSATYTYTNDANEGGRGGGAIALLGATRIDVSGTIDVQGLVGGATGPTPTYGAGGGAGGMIAIEAPEVTIGGSAKLLAGGGRGGGGVQGGLGSTSDAAGANGTTNSASNLGGGGGGAGRILIKSSDAGASVATTALTPSVGLCAVLDSL
jgi:hypothetical protein